MPDFRDAPLSAACPSYGGRRRIGIMGGSFNPAHDGHLHVAIQTRKQARLDQVWWLVSPQNPLKPTEHMAKFENRIASARALSRHLNWIKVLDFEQRQGLIFTVDSLEKLLRCCPQAELIWIMGADNLIQFPKWSRAHQLSRRIPILVVNRPSFGYKSLASSGAALLGRHRRRLCARQLGAKKGGWAFLHSAANPASSTALRNKREDILPLPKKTDSL